MSNETLPMEIEPVLSRMKEYPATPDQLIPLLQFCQNQMGYLVPEAMSAIAEYLRLPSSHVYGVATFYAQFRFRPLGKNRLTVCRGTACHVRGSARLVEEVEKILGIKAGDSTADMMFSLETVACLGSCALAPAVVVNDKVHGKVTNKKIGKIIAGLRGGSAPAEAEPAPADEAAAPPATTPAPAAPAVKAKKSVAGKAKAKPASVPRAKASARKTKDKAAPKPAARKAKAKPAAVKAAGKRTRKAVAKPAAKGKQAARSRWRKTRRSR
jgi:NADH-quinone oxidoreductase subunit E